MSQTKAVPKVNDGLIDWLERTYPDRLPTVATSERELARLIGQQDVVRKLRQLYDKQL